MSCSYRRNNAVSTSSRKLKVRTTEMLSGRAIAAAIVRTEIRNAWGWTEGLEELVPGRGELCRRGPEPVRQALEYVGRPPSTSLDKGTTLVI